MPSGHGSSTLVPPWCLLTPSSTSALMRPPCKRPAAQRSQPPPEPVTGKRGAPRKKGPVIGAPKTLTTPSAAWQPHPQEAGAFIQAWVGIGPSVFPGRLLRVVVVWRPHLDGPATPN